MTIYSLHTPDQAVTLLPYWNRVPFVAEKEHIEFSDGLNIVFGPNGSGKTTLIKTLALALHAFQGGFQKVTEDSLRSVFQIERLTAGEKAETEYGKKMQRGLTDGEEVRYVSADQDVGFYTSQFDNDFFRDGVAMRMMEASSGQKSLAKVNRILKAKPRPLDKNIFSIEKERVNSLWQNRISIVEQILKGKRKQRKASLPAILLDEPDRSMDFKIQVELWDLLKQTTKCQIIVSTHSIFALGISHANYIETVPGAVDSLTEALHKGGWAHTSKEE